MSFWNKKDRVETNSAVGPEPVQAPTAAPAAEQDSRHDEQPRHDRSIVTPFSPGTFIHGKLNFSSPIRIEGQLSGEVFSSSMLVIGENGSMDARSDVRTLDIYGSVRGRVQAREEIRVRRGAELSADVDTPRLIIEEGGRFNGMCRMAHARSAAVNLNECVEPLKLVG